MFLLVHSISLAHSLRPLGIALGNSVTFVVSDCLNETVEGAVVSATGLDFPYEHFVDTTDINGICVFDITTGNWDFTISKIGDVDYSFIDFISQDTSYSISLDKKLYPPRNIWVDSITATAYWDEPLIMALYDNFDEGDIYISGWQMTSNGQGWVQTDDGGSAGFYIPPKGSTYVCVNDNVAGSGNNGCCDMLITPILDLREAENYILSFDSYYTGMLGMMAVIEYSHDQGNTWTPFYSLTAGAVEEWKHIEVDLTAFSGPTAQESIMFAFHADDGGGQASGWAIDNVDINAGPTGDGFYDVFLDSAFVTYMDTTYYQFCYLQYGVNFTACVAFQNYGFCGLSEWTCVDFTSWYLKEPHWLIGDSVGGNVELMWLQGSWPEDIGVVGFNIYRDSINIAYVPYTGIDTNYYIDVLPDPMCYNYQVSAVHDLSIYGFPGDTGESQYVGPAEVCLLYGTQMPIEEDWSSGSFGSFWVPDENWRINGQYGNPMPSAEFTWNPIMTNYEAALTSGPINGGDHDNKSEPYVDGDFILAFDLKLDDNSMSGNEYFNIEVWSNGVWTRMNQESNANGSFDWKHKEINITEEAMGNVFKVRFAVTGEVSSDIISWLLDNISIERVCYPPTELTVEPIDPWTLELNWIPPVSTGSGGGEWLMWDDGANAGDGIGLTAGGTFSVASHWDPDMISQYDGMFIAKIRFFAYDNAVTSSFTLKVWEGIGASMIYEEAVSGVVVGTWNEVTLSSPVMIDASQELWFGYSVTHPAGENPAGFDDGPGNPGYGDMICTDGTTWEPLSNLIAFDGNWNIQAFVGEITDVVLSSVLDAEKSTKELLRYDIYWNDNGGVGDFEFLDSTQDTFYSHFEDPPFIFGTIYTYRVHAMYEDCEAMGQGEIIWEGIDDNGIENSVWIYPNPSNDLINIESTKDINKLCLLDNSGRMLQCYELLNETHYQIDVSDYEPGVYLLRIDTEQGRAVRKLVVME